MSRAAGGQGIRRGTTTVGAGLMVVLSMLAASVTATTKPDQPAFVAVIIDDLGNNYERGIDAADLPGPVACAILPDRPYSRSLAERAHEAGKEVLLHLPLEPTVRKDLLGPGALTDNMDLTTVERSLRNSLGTVPFAIAVNNHMGSRYTQDNKAMDRLMESIHILRPGFFFVDSLTTPHSVVPQAAAEYGIPTLSRDVFLDDERTADAIDKQVDLLFRIARKRGSAIAIGHPYPETLQVLERRLKPLRKGDLRLVPLSLLLAMKMRPTQP